ncbi:MAG: diguanylate cyclase [Candidatus Competibacteraceae bacterium]|nr:diguanylate cyclase [Candidatus Competibacteraceae bacterium]
MDQESILIVEDDGIIAAYLQDTLTRLGYIVPEPVATGEAAVAAAVAAPPDLVLMDIQLAGAMDGVTAAERIRMAFDIPIVYLTAFTRESQLQQAKMTAPYGYLVKPVSERELLATLEMALYKHNLDRRLRQSEEWLTLALWGADLGMWDCDTRTNTVLYSGRWAEILGYALTEIAPNYASWEDRVHPDDLPAMQEAFNAHLEHRAPFYESEHRLQHQDGHWVWVQAKGKVTERDLQDRPLRACGVLLDISERKRLEEELRQLAATDPLTGAFNRRYFLHSVGKEISRAQRYARPLTLIMFDIDYFKRINDTLGHEQGDEVLRTMTTRIRQRLRHSDVLVRWGGEEFMILAVETSLSQSVALAETLWAALRDAPFADIGAVTASFGVTEYRPDETLDQWLKRVDDLMYQAKSKGRDRVCYSGESAA